MKSTVETLYSGDDSDEVLIVEETLEELVLVTTEQKALVDCACPNTVSGRKWIEAFCANLDANDKLKATVSESV